MFKPKTILVPSDFSPYSDKALEYAVDIARQHGSTIYLFHSIGVIQQCSMDYCIDQSALDQIENQMASASLESLKKQVAGIPDATGVDIRIDVKRGSASEQILHEQETKSADLIVIASHGRTGILGHLMGSVAERVSRHAKCPVLLIRP